MFCSCCSSIPKPYRYSDKKIRLINYSTTTPAYPLYDKIARDRWSLTSVQSRPPKKLFELRRKKRQARMKHLRQKLKKLQYKQQDYNTEEQRVINKRRPGFYKFNGNLFLLTPEGALCYQRFRLTVALSRHRSAACVSPSTQSFAASAAPPSRLNPGQLALVLLYRLELADRSNRRVGGEGAFDWLLYTRPCHVSCHVISRQCNTALHVYCRRN